MSDCVACGGSRKAIPSRIDGPWRGDWESISGVSVYSASNARRP